MVGQIIGHYYIEARIGEGKFATVYKCQDIRLKRTVAVKILKEKYHQGGAAWGRLLREARIASKLNHPNICTLYDIGEDQEHNYVVFEFVEGKTLRAILESGSLPIKTVFEYGKQIAEAKAHIHSTGTLHGDLKSANIMVTPEGHIKVVDFGLARLLEETKAIQEQDSFSSAQRIGWLAGTLPYMAPELLHGEVATMQSGVWSLGVVLFEMLTGQLPFAGRTPFELGAVIMTGKVKELPTEVPLGLRSIVQRCLVLEKENRYNSAVEVLNHLESEHVSYQVRAILANRPSSPNRGYSVKRWLSALSLIWGMW